MSDIFHALPDGVQAELHVSTVNSAEVKYANSEFEGTSERRHQSQTLRLIRDGRLSISQSSKPLSEDVQLEAALDMVPYGTSVQYDFPGAGELADIELADPAVAGVGLDEMIEVVDDLAGTLIERDERIRVMAGTNRSVVHVSLHNSNGFAGEYTKTAWTAGLGGRLVQGDDFLWFGEYRSAWSPSDIDYDQLKAEVIQQYEWAKNTVPLEARAYPVIFVPSQVVFLLRPFVASLDGKAFARGISPWVDKLDQELLDSRFTLVDDGTLQRSPTSAPFDREGVPTRRNVLIDAGVPKGLILDLQTAAELGREPTGNGSLRGPSPHRLLLTPGDTPLSALISDIDRGIIVYGTMGAWTGNPYSGNVSGTISLGLKIEDGEVQGRIKNCMFSINAFDHFRDRLVALSRETVDITGGGLGAGGATLPYVLLDDVVIATN